MKPIQFNIRLRMRDEKPVVVSFDAISDNLFNSLYESLTEVAGKKAYIVETSRYGGSYSLRPYNVFYGSRPELLKLVERLRDYLIGQEYRESR